MTRRRLAALLLLLVPLLGGGGGDVDAAFLAALRASGISYSSAADAVAAAHLVCAKLGAGETPVQIAGDVMSRSNLDGYHAGFFVGAAIGAYCPTDWNGP